MNNDYRQSREFRDLLNKNGAFVITFGLEAGYSVASTIPLLKTLILPRVENPGILEEAEKIPYKYRSQFVMVAPKAVLGSQCAKDWTLKLSKFGYRPAKVGLAPTKTLEIDIRFPENEILGRMLSQTRYNIRLSERKGATIEIVGGSKILSEIGHLDSFFKIYHDNCIRGGIKSESKNDIRKMLEVFRNKIFFVFGYINGEIGAVASFIISGNMISYYLNGSTESGRNSFATKLVVWEGMKEGKKNGCEWFDFDGIFDERYEKAQKDWKGFSRFKSGFGGCERTYLGSFVKWFPFLKTINYQV
ncbi:MAG: peptidoglycan bridge formation glycyltransferase FemA/FemB family protein [bacterium]|jgi:hypothetical protein|nr:peptidoglycan bridge formation glycyltransferase FemA/FemB family protein [bacterium]